MQFFIDFISNTNIQFYIIGYLIGGIPFGLLITKKFTSIDIRESGSGNIGATNVLRVLKKTNPSLAKKIAIATLLLDALKATLLLGFGSYFGLGEDILWTISVLLVIGHCYSPYLKFEGGKGVATSMGVMFFMLPLEMLLAITVWAIVAKIVRISSISSISALMVLVSSSFVIHPDITGIQTHAPILFIAFIITYKHIPNIIDLCKKKEPKSI